MPISAVSKIEKIGYELVRTDDMPKTDEPPATMEDYAALDFEPWKDEGGLKDLNEKLNECGIAARIADRTMLKSKTELMTMLDELSDEGADKLMAHLAESVEGLKAMALMIDGAYLRILVAASALELQKQNQKN